MRIIIFFTILHFTIWSRAFSQDSNSVNFKMELVVSRDSWCKTIYNGEYVQAHFRFSCESPTVLVFDYNNIFNTDSTFCKQFETINKYFMADINSPAYLYLENEKGYFVSPKELSLFYIGKVYAKLFDKPNNYDIIPICSDDFKFFIYSLPIPLRGLKEMCGGSTKIRFHYFYKPIEKYKHFNNDSLHLISNWFNIKDIK